MKQKDIAMIIVIIVVSAVFSVFISQLLFVTKKDKQLSAEVVPKITSEFNVPDKSVFNENAVNPTQLIQIGNNTNTSIF